MSEWGARVKRRTWYLIAICDYEPVAVMLSMISLMQGAGFFMGVDVRPWPLSAVVLASIAPVEAWSSIFLTVGLWQLVAIWELLPRTGWGRQVCYLANGALWTFVAVLIGMRIGLASSPTLFYLVIAGASVWVFVREGARRWAEEHKVHDDRSGSERR